MPASHTIEVHYFPNSLKVLRIKLVLFSKIMYEWQAIDFLWASTQSINIINFVLFISPETKCRWLAKVHHILWSFCSLIAEVSGIIIERASTNVTKCFPMTLIISPSPAEYDMKCDELFHGLRFWM